MLKLGKTSKRDLILVGFFFLVLISVATIFYRFIEGWGWVDSFYFSATTLMTIGHAELLPSSDVSKIFTAILSFGGITTFLVLITLIADSIHQNEIS